MLHANEWYPFSTWLFGVEKLEIKNLLYANDVHSFFSIHSLDLTWDT